MANACNNSTAPASRAWTARVIAERAAVVFAI